MHLWINENTSYTIPMKRSGTAVDMWRKGIILFSRKWSCDYTFGTSVWEEKWRLLWEEAWREGAWGSGFMRWWKLSSPISWILGLAFVGEVGEDGGRGVLWRWAFCHLAPCSWLLPPACLGCPPKILSGVPADKTVIPTNPVRECSPRAYTLERGWKRPQGKYAWV